MSLRTRHRVKRRLARHVRTLACAATTVSLAVLLMPAAASADARPAQLHQLTVEAVGLDGAPPKEWEVGAHGVDKVEFEWAQIEEGTATLLLPAGDYVVTSSMGESSANPVLQSVSVLDFRADTTLRIDAREARPVDVSVFDTSAERFDRYARLNSPSAGIEWGAEPGATVRTQHIGPVLSAEQFNLWYEERWRAPDGTEYHLAYQGVGGVFTGLTEHADRSTLTRVDLDLGSPVPGATGELAVFGPNYYSPFLPKRQLPGTATTYVSGGEASWAFGLQVSNDEGEVIAWHDGPHRSYSAGETVALSLNVGVFGPALGEGDGFVRSGDELHLSLGLLTDGGGNEGYFTGLTQARTSLTSEGELIAEVLQPMGRGSFDGLPAAEKPYELTTTIRRDAPVSTEITASFTFVSARPGEGEEVALPASVVRFTPQLALDSTAPAGEEMTIPVTVTGSAAGENLAALRVEVSHDGGASWQQAPVVDGAVTVTNPAAGGSVSLRAEVTDRQGNGTTQTIIDAYRTA